MKPTTVTLTINRINGHERVPTQNKTPPSKQTVQPTGPQSVNKMPLPTPVTLGVTVTGKLVKQQMLQPHIAGVPSAKTQPPAQFDSRKPPPMVQQAVATFKHPWDKHLTGATSQGHVVGVPSTSKAGVLARSATNALLAAYPRDGKTPSTGTTQSGSAPANSPTYASKVDKEHAGRELGKGQTIGQSGAALVAVANARKGENHGVTVTELDKKLDRSNGYAGKTGNSVVWQNLSDKDVKVAKVKYSIAEIDKQLKAGRSVVVGVDNQAGSRGGTNGTDTWGAIVGKRQDAKGNTFYRAVDSQTGKTYEMRKDGNQLQRVDNANWKTSNELVVFNPNRQKTKATENLF